MEIRYAFHTSLIAFLIVAAIGFNPSVSFAQPVIVDHTSTNILLIPEYSIAKAKATLHIAYGHTSHGSQLTDGMSGLVGFVNNGGLGLSLPQDTFAWDNGGIGGALDLHDYAMGGDVGYYPQWVNNTRNYLDDPVNADVNVIIWSWCGQASGYTETDMTDYYLAPMTQLEADYPNVVFVYMTGHADGSGETGNLHLRNQQIRDYCVANDKVLYDYYDIECYDPGDNYYGDKLVNDNCDYDSSGDGSLDGNWAIEWQGSHTENIDWYSCNSAHSQPLNANRKAYAAWWLWARLAGWKPGICQCSMAPFTADIPRGSHLIFNITISNNTGGAGFIKFATRLSKPGTGQQTGILIGPADIFLGQFQSKPGSKRHSIGTAFPLGSYRYHGYVYKYGKIYDECTFDFEVTDSTPGTCLACHK